MLFKPFNFCLCNFGVICWRSTFTSPSYNADFITCINKISIDKIKYLFYQLLIGNGIHSVFWFQFNIIFISLIFSIIIFLSKKSFFFYLFLIGIICYLFVIYSNNTNFFSKFNYIVVFPLRPIASSFIYSLMGFFLFLIKIEKLKLKKYKIKTIFICLLFLSLYPYYKRKFENDSYFLIILLLIEFNENN